jgi:signal peptidase I
MQAEEQIQPKKRSALRELAETIVITLLLYLLVRTFLFENYKVVGRSMELTLVNDQFVVVNKLSYRLHDPQRGDIIVFRDWSTEDRKLIKRVIGLPGETIEIRNGQTFVNGVILDEPYIELTGRDSRPATPVPEGSYYVLGDNRSNSQDSRSRGPLDGDNIVGKAWFTYWPPDRWGIVPHTDYEGTP